MISSAAFFHWQFLLVRNSQGVTHMKGPAIPLDLTDEPGDLIVSEGSIKIRKDKNKLKVISVFSLDTGILTHTSTTKCPVHRIVSLTK